MEFPPLRRVSVRTMAAYYRCTSRSDCLVQTPKRPVRHAKRTRRTESKNLCTLCLRVSYRSAGAARRRLLDIRRAVQRMRRIDPSSGRGGNELDGNAARFARGLVANDVHVIVAGVDEGRTQRHPGPVDVR